LFHFNGWHIIIHTPWQSFSLTKHADVNVVKSGVVDHGGGCGEIQVTMT